MAHIVLTCWGSHGDVDPFIGLALALQRRGHTSTLATLEYYRRLVTEAGLGFRPIRPRIDPTQTDLVARIMDRRRGSEFLLRDILFPAIREMFEDVSAAATDADLLISHPITFATPIVAQQRGLPWASVALAPMTFFSAYDYPVLPPAPWTKSLQRFGLWPGRLIVGFARLATRTWPESLYALRAQLGLPRGGHPVFEGQHSPSLVLAMYSRLLGDPQPDWPAHVAVTGHVFHDATHGTRLAPDLESFLSSGPPPVVFTLGSSAVLVAGRFWRDSIEAARRLQARAVLLAGPEQAPILQRELQQRGLTGIMAVERAPHSLLFPRASAIVQQCGIGTLAQGLRSGRPLLAVPYAHDQPDNAWRAARLGVARIVHPPSYKAPRVARELGRLLEEPAYAAAAARVAAMITREGGSDVACDAIARTFSLR